MAIVNKDLIQSYIMTTAKYDFNVYEKRIIYRLVEMAQGELQGIKFANNCQKIEHDLFSCINITMPIACLLNGEEDKNYARVKEALQSLQRKIFEYEDDEVWQSISIIALPFETSLDFASLSRITAVFLSIVTVVCSFILLYLHRLLHT